MDVRLKCSSAFIVEGPSGSGKTNWVMRLLDHKQDMFDIPPKRILWFYDSYQPEFQKKDYIIHHGLPAKLHSLIQPYDCIVLDDLASKAINSVEVSQLFTQLVHHKPCCCILITQHLFSKGRESRTQHLNASYLVLFKNPRDSTQCSYIGRQMLPGGSRFLQESFQDATRTPHSYLFIDLRQETPDEIRLRTRILPGEEPQIVYQSYA